MSQCILVVEDDQSIQAMVTVVLENSGYEVVVVSTGAEMFAALLARKVDLILLDLGLPDGDALPYIQEVRAKHDLPVMILTGRQKMDDRLMALGLGANDYLTKPIDPRELVLRIGNMLSPGNAQKPPAAPTTSVPPVGTRPPAKKPKRDMATIYGVIVVILALGIGGAWYVSPATENGTEPVNQLPATPVASTSEPSREIETADIPVPVTVDRSPIPITAPPEQQMPQPVRTETRPSENEIKLSKAEILGYGWVLKTQCAPIPDVPWWKLRSHEGIVGYVVRRYEGDWARFENELVVRLAKMYDIAERKSGVVVQDGLTLRGEALAEYIEQFTQRLAVVRCLEAEATEAERQ